MSTTLVNMDRSPVMQTLAPVSAMEEFGGAETGSEEVHVVGLRPWMVMGMTIRGMCGKSSESGMQKSLSGGISKGRTGAIGSDDGEGVAIVFAQDMIVA